MKKLLTVLAASILLAATAQAGDERATPQDAEDLVKTATSFLKKQGPEKAYAEFQRKGGPFIYKDLYVMVYDMSGRCLAHGADPSKVGKDLIDQKDANGKAYTRERLQIAKEKGAGWQEYVYKNPATGKVEPKVVYFEKANEVVVSAGAYKP
jgi:cytochrome c